MTAVRSARRPAARPSWSTAGFVPVLSVLLGLLIAAGSWLQTLPISGSLTLYGVGWGLACIAIIASLLFFRVDTQRVQIAPLLATTVGFASVFGGTITGPLAAKAVPTLVALALLPLCTALPPAIHREAARDRLASGLELALVVQAILIVPKLAVYGTSAQVISSRPFGLAAAVAFAWRSRHQAGPRQILSDRVAWCLLACAVLSQSRTALGGMILTVLLTALRPLDARGPRLMRVLVASGLIVAALTFGLAVSETARSRTFGADEGNEPGLSLSNRERIWPELLDDLVGDPFTPRGAGSSAKFVERRTNGLHGNPHNDYLRLWFEGGALGLVAFTTAGLTSVAIGLRRFGSDPSNGSARAAVAIAIGVGLSLAFTNALTYMSVTAPAVLLVSVALHRTRPETP